MSRLAALVLAAGYSSRAPGLKPLLPLGDATVIETAINSLYRGGVGDITVVLGHRAGDMLPVLAGLPVRHVFNKHYTEGMFSSVLTGLRSLPAATDAFFLLPADIPLVSSHTVRLLARAYQKTGADVVYPVFQGRRGHPPLIAARLLPAILGWSGPQGMRSLLAQYEAEAYELEVLDEGVELDIDTPADYQGVVEHCRHRHIPTRNECDAILAKLKVADITVRHGRMVSDVAGRLAERLNQAGAALDVGLVRAAGLLHDLAKGRPDHARCGARFLIRLGYPQVAQIVACHTDIVFEEGMVINEAVIVYLADKLVKHDRIVSVQERFQGSLEKFAADLAAMAAVAGRLANTQSIMKLVEQTMGAELGPVIAADSQPLSMIGER